MQRRSNASQKQVFSQSRLKKWKTERNGNFWSYNLWTSWNKYFLIHCAEKKSPFHYKWTFNKVKTDRFFFWYIKWNYARSNTAQNKLNQMVCAAYRGRLKVCILRETYSRPSYINESVIMVTAGLIYPPPPCESDWSGGRETTAWRPNAVQTLCS